MSEVLPLPAGPEITVKLPVSIFRLMPDRTEAEAGQAKKAFFTSKAIFDSISRFEFSTFTHAFCALEPIP